ncbi:MAG: hypothetical protein J6W75_13095 [Bacteroidaceae bacterium]|nr:hypothetical protein [Bacteroidaceae bacterium]
MKKMYIQPSMSGFTIGTCAPLLSNSLVDNKINIDTSSMEEGDGSDGVKSDQDWDDIWSD